MNGESANKFISALVKSLQTLCHGYVEFNDGIEIIGHLYLNIDSGSSFDYIVKEKVCKNAENSTVFVSKSYAAQSPPGELVIRRDKDSLDNEQAAEFEDSSMSPTSGTSRLQSAITSISNVLSGTQENQKPRHLNLEQPSHASSTHIGVKRKREHNGTYTGMHPPYKYTTLQSSSTSSGYFNSTSSKQAADRNHSEHFSSSSHAEFFGGDSNQSSGMGPDDEDDLDLDVTFVKEEYSESQRISNQRGVSAGAASRLCQDPSSSQSNLHDAGGTLGYPSGQAPPSQQFTSGTAADLGALTQSFQDPQVDLVQHHVQAPPNPRTSVALRGSSTGHDLMPSSPSATDLIQDAFESPDSPGNPCAKGDPFIHTLRQTKWAVAKARDDASAGAPPRMPEGVKPLCGYVHPEDAEKWMMLELLPGSGVYIHQENYNVVMSKTRQDRPDGKAMARYLMSCFWRQSELVGSSIAEPPKPHHKSLDRGMVHAILGFCQHHSRELPTDIRRTIQQKIGYAKFYFVKKTQDLDSPKMTPAAISVEASPRRMSMEMARRAAGGSLLPESGIRVHGRKGKKLGQQLARGMSEPMDLLSRTPSARATPDAEGRVYMDTPGDGSDRMETNVAVSGRMTAPSSTSELLSDRLPSDMTSRLPGELCNRITNDLARRISSDLVGRIPGDFPSRMTSDLSGRMSGTEHLGRLPEDLSSRTSSDLPVSSSSDLPNRMSEVTNRLAGGTVDAMAVRTSESGVSDLASRMGPMPSGMSRGFLDMLNNIYPSN